MKGYIREFDTLRAFAVFGVMIHHYFGQYPALSFLGSGGVTLFFVLSGCLITNILLNEKDHFKIDHRTNQHKIGYVLKVFYIRRSFRIFPIYYLALIVLAIIGIDSAREHFFFHFFYASNFLYVFVVPMDRLAHFWSLAVEEQFYLIWPLLILLMSFRISRIKFFSILLILSLVFKIAVFLLYYNSPLQSPAAILMPSCIESFSLGAMVVVLAKQTVSKALVNTILGVSLTLFVVLKYVDYSYDTLMIEFLYVIFARTFFSIFSATILLIIVNNWHNGLARKMLNFPLLILIGKISYGIYIYHIYTPVILTSIQKFLHFDLSGMGILMPLNFLVTFLIAYISYRLIEKPVNNLKTKFAYKL